MSTPLHIQSVWIYIQHKYAEAVDLLHIIYKQRQGFFKTGQESDRLRLETTICDDLDFLLTTGPFSIIFNASIRRSQGYTSERILH